MNKQDAIVKESTQSIVEIPWAPWLTSAVGRDMDLERSLIAAVNIALHSLHTSCSLVNAPIRFMLNESTKKITAIATRDIDEDELELPPCTPGAGSKLSKEATRPNAVPIQIEENHVNMSVERKKRMSIKTPEGTPAASSTIKTITHTLFVFPDTKLPSWESVLDTAVAGTRRAMKPLDGKEVMHPFFLVPRVTDKELKARNEDQSTKAKFNLEIKKTSLGVVTTGSLMKKKTNIAWSVHIPIISNNKLIKAGDELFLKVADPKKKEKEPIVETWKESAKRSAAVQDAHSASSKKHKGNGNKTETDAHFLSIRI